MTSKTIALSGAEIRADYSGGTNAWLRNDGTATVYASTAPGVTAGADGVVSIPAGQAAAIYGACGAVYLLGTGSVQLVGSDYTACPFKTSAQSGGSGADSVARAAIEAHSGNADIHVTADEKAGWNGKADPADIPTKVSDLVNDSGFITSPDGGNAVSSDLAKYIGTWGSPEQYYGNQLKARILFNKFGDSRLGLTTDTDNEIRVDYATNVDTLDGLHESSFAQNIGVWSEGDIKDLLLNCTKSGFVFIHPGVTGMPSDNMYWFGLVDCNTAHRQLIVRNVVNNAAYSIIWNHGTQTWTVWNNLADGGNADTLDGKHASDFAQNSGADFTGNISMQGNKLWLGISGFVSYYLQCVNGELGIYNHDGTRLAYANYNEFAGGNAASVGAYTEEKLAALEARIAALEGGGT